MSLAYRRCCGIDVHKKSLSVCIRPPVGRPDLPVREETFRTFTKDLRRLRQWWIQCRVTELAMESTGQYWRPVWNVLEGAVARMLLLNPAHVKGLAGHKTDRKDAQWLATRLEREDLRGSFVPAQPLREMREWTRLRVHWLQDLNRIKNRIGNICESGNIKISSVASDRFGKSGRRMLDAIVTGDRDPGWMADYAKGTLRGKRDLLELALEGSFTPHQRWLLGQSVRQMSGLEGEIAGLTREIEQRATATGWDKAISRLCTIPGVDRVSAWSILAEAGLDMAVLGDAAHLASWAALCPGQRESGKTRKGNVYLRRVLCQCAGAAAHTKGAFLGLLYRRIRGRKGHQKAIMGVAHRILVIIFHLLHGNDVYHEWGEDFHAQRNQEKAARRHAEGLHRLGCQVTLQKMVLQPLVEPVAEVLVEAVVGERATRRRGRPCKCGERGIVCKHRPALRRGAEKLPENTGPADSQTIESTGLPAEGFS